MGGVVDVKRPGYLAVAWIIVFALIVSYLIVFGLRVDETRGMTLENAAMEEESGA